MAAGDTTPYSTVAPLFGALPSWVPTLEQERIESYRVYEDIYWNNPGVFKVIARGAEDKPIYVPTGRTIVDTTNRYVGTGFNFMVDPLVGTPAEREAATLAFTALFAREKMKSKYAANKRYGLIRGDWLWHIVADPEKPEGKRISIYAVDPGSWFPVYDDNNLDHLIKIHLVEQFLNEKNEVRLKRLTYEWDPAGSGQILMSEGVWKLDKWFTPENPEVVITPPTLLPAEITSFPVYNIKNFEEPGNPYGSSELRGLERIMQAVNQAVSDEDIALALEGLGVYATDGGGPVDEDGNETDWILGPGEVVENGLNFRRVSGVSSLEPYTDHINRLITFMQEASATPAVAIGKVDVQVAESGIALALQMGPMLSKAIEKDQEILDVHTQMFYDLRAWFQVYEGINLQNVSVLPVLGDKLPLNKEKEVNLILSLVNSGLMSKETARPLLAKYGYVFAPNENDLITEESKQAASVFAEAGLPPGAEEESADAGRLAAEGA